MFTSTPKFGYSPPSSSKSPAERYTCPTPLHICTDSSMIYDPTPSFTKFRPNDCIETPITSTSSMLPPLFNRTDSPTSADPHVLSFPAHCQERSIYPTTSSLLQPYGSYDHPSPSSSSSSSPSTYFSSESEQEEYELLASAYCPRFPVGHELLPSFVAAYELGEELGAGGYGFVLTARHRRERHEVAVKFIIKEKVPDNAWMDDEELGRLPAEVMLLSFVDHPGVVKLLDVFEDQFYFYMIQELHGTPWKKEPAPQTLSPASASCPPLLSPSISEDSLADSDPETPPAPHHASLHGDITEIRIDSPTSYEPYVQRKSPPRSKSSKAPRLTLTVPAPRPQFERRASHDLFECIETSPQKRLSEEDAKYVFAQVVEAVYYLHSLGIAHRDIKDENLVIDKDLTVKLIDFGSAVHSDPSIPGPYYDLFFGTNAYASSEILRKTRYQAAPAEVWTLGVLLSYLLTGSSPFLCERDAVYGKITLSRPLGATEHGISPDAYSLLRWCLHPDPSRRSTITDIRNHRWLRGALNRPSRAV